MTFEEFYYILKSERPNMPNWQIEDEWDADTAGHRVHDPDRWRFLRKKRKSEITETL